MIHTRFPRFLEPPVDITGLLNQQFKSGNFVPRVVSTNFVASDSFDMSNFFGMSQINGHLPGSITNQMPSMALPFTAPPSMTSMTLQNSMQMPVSASTSSGPGIRPNPVSSAGLKSKQRLGSDNLIKCNFCPKKFSSNQVLSISSWALHFRLLISRLTDC